MKRIVYLNKVKIDLSLPAVNFSLFNAYALARAGADSYLIVQKNNPDFDDGDLYLNFNLKPLENFHLVVYPHKNFLGIKTNQWFYLQAFSAIKKLHRAQGVQAVISRDPGALPYLARLRKKCGLAVFYQPHNFYVDLSIRPDVNPRNAKKYHLLEKYFIPKLNALLCLQESQAALFQKYFPAMKVFAAKPGLMKLNPLIGLNQYNTKLIGYIGSLQLKKGIIDLLNAFVLLKSEGYKLVLIGGRNLQEIEPVRNKINALGLGDEIKITGWIPFSDVETYLQQISVGVIPLRDTFYNRYLTAPNKLFDYLSYGIPIVATDLPAIRDFRFTNKVGLLYKSEQPESLASIIRSVFSNRQEYLQQRQNALELARSYLWKNRAEKMMQMIDQTT